MKGLDRGYADYREFGRVPDWWRDGANLVEPCRTCGQDADAPDGYRTLHDIGDDN